MNATQLSQQKAYADACMNISLEVSEFFIFNDRYFQKHDIRPIKNTQGVLIDMPYIQAEFNKILEKNVLFLSEGKNHITPIDLMKIKYFHSSFQEFKKEIYAFTLDYYKKHKSTHHNYSYSYFLRDVRDFSRQLDAVISNWVDNYTPILEKNLLSTAIASGAPKSDKKTNTSKI